MTERDRILAVVLKHLRANVEDLPDTPIDPGQSMAELGATSVDIIEIVSGTMRELGVHVPRAKLLGLRNIEELVALLASYAGGRA